MAPTALGTGQRAPGTHAQHAALGTGQPADRDAGGSVRLRSVDVFRGVTMAAMVIVNNPGDWGNVYPPLLHAAWHGWTPTDLVFPFFLFIVGVAITLSPTSSGAFGGVLRRSAVIFGLGLFLAGFPVFNLATWRIPGVLQRIAVCYLAAVALVRWTAPRDNDTRSHMRRIAALIVAIVSSYAALMLWMPVPGGHAGDLTPDGNLGAWIDRALMQGHLWRPQWDPEGLLSTLPALATTLMGVVAGQARLLVPAVSQSGVPATRVVRGGVEAGVPATRVVRGGVEAGVPATPGVGGVAKWRRQLVIGGAMCLALGAVWHTSFPINKSLWTSSYVLFTGGVAAISLALCSAWSDDTSRGWRLRTSEPFVALGRNAILLFVLSGLIARLMGLLMVDAEARVSVKGWIYSTLFAPFASAQNASLLFAVANLLLLYALLAWLHRRRLYWKV